MDEQERHAMGSETGPTAARLTGDPPVRRSELTCPGLSLKMMAKAAASPADQVIFDLEDACVVVHTDAGKVQVKQAVNLTKAGAATGLSTGMLIGALAGLLVLNPLAGMVVGGLSGAGFGALSGKMADYGINDDFIKNLGNTIPKGSSALFVLIPLQAGMEIGDLSRVLQGVTAGIGFIGAGAILKHHQNDDVKGVTTAASVWLTAAIGIAAGMGREATAVLSALFALVILAILRITPKYRGTPVQK